MARTIEEIQSQILTEKASRSELDRLSSSSATAVWRIWVYITAVIIHFHETIFDLFRAEVEQMISSLQPGTPAWYISRIREFQAGDNIQVINGVATYTSINESKRIVSRASYRDLNDGLLTLKVAKGEIGTEEALTSEEIFQLNTYLDRIKFAGTKINLISLNADKLRLTAEIFFDGLYSTVDVKGRVKTAIREYLKNLDFDGRVYTNKLIDAIQSVEGVIDIQITSAVGVSGATNTPITRVYETVAGYIVEDTEAGFSFDDLLTFTPINNV